MQHWCTFIVNVLEKGDKFALASRLIGSLFVWLLVVFILVSRKCSAFLKLGKKGPKNKYANYVSYIVFKMMFPWQ